MADRSDLMRRIKGSDTLPERLLSEALRRRKIKHVRNDKRLPGTPDIALHDRRVAVFVHGCFWHGCPLHYREPRTRVVFWRQKLARTRSRDRRARIALVASGWKVVTIWEHEVKRDPDRVAQRVLSEGPPSPGSTRRASRSSPLKGL